MRPDAALEALTAFLGTHAPEVADAAADYLARQRANGQLIQDGKRSGRVVVVAHWSAKGSGFRWFTKDESHDAVQAWVEEKAAADKIGSGYYAIKFVAEANHLDVPHRVTDDIASLFDDIMECEDTITYNKGKYRRGNDEITQEEADKAVTG